MNRGGFGGKSLVLVLVLGVKDPLNKTPSYRYVVECVPGKRGKLGVDFRRIFQIQALYRVKSLP